MVTKFPPMSEVDVLVCAGWWTHSCSKTFMSFSKLDSLPQTSLTSQMKKKRGSGVFCHECRNCGHMKFVFKMIVGVSIVQCLQSFSASSTQMNQNSFLESWISKCCTSLEISESTKPNNVLINQVNAGIASDKIESIEPDNDQIFWNQRDAKCWLSRQHENGYVPLIDTSQLQKSTTFSECHCPTANNVTNG